MPSYYVTTVSSLIGWPVDIDTAYASLEAAKAALRAAVKASAAECRRKYKAAGTIKNSDTDYEIRIEGRNGYHLWERIIVANVPHGSRIHEVQS